MLIVKYGCSLTSANKAGTSMSVNVFSDSVGGTTAAAVVEGDVVVEVIAGTPVSVAFWVAHDGSAWEQIYPGTVSNGDLIMVWGGTVDYQNGAMFAVAPDGSLITPNIGVMTDIAERTMNP